MMDIAVGVALYKAFVATGALISGLGAGRSLLDPGESKSVSEILEALAAQHASSAEPPSATVHQTAEVALIAAFGAAFRHSWADNTRLAPWKRGRLLAAWLTADRRSQQHRQAMISFALAQAMGEIAASSEGSDVYEPVGGDPCATPLFRHLWAAFTTVHGRTELQALKAVGLPVNPDAAADSLLGATIDVHAFERRVRIEYATNMVRAGVSVRDLAATDAATRRTRLLRAAMVEMTRWPEARLFGESDAMPEMTLREAYVEPRAHRKVDGPTTAQPALTILANDLVRSDPVITLILGDFGLGKSLTAKMFAANLAADFLSTRSPSIACWMPVYVRCSDCLDARPFDSRDVVKRGLRLVLQEAGVSVSVLDEALGTESTQRVCVLLDGLDERAMTEMQIKEFFRALAEQSSPTTRFVVFSRPGAIHHGVSDDRVVKTNTLIMSVFDAHQVREWIQRWNDTVRVDKSPIETDAIAAHRLDEAARTPVVLFVIAFTWDEIRGELALGRAVLYERFFAKIANGKLTETGDQHEPILRSADAVREALRPRLLVQDSSSQEALLFALSHVAWRSHCLEQQGKDMNRRTLEKMFVDDFGMDDSDGAHFELIRDGILLSLQHDESAGSTKILYGHKSFREFLVARFWLHTLRRACVSGDTRHLVVLFEGLLDVYQDAAKRFLEEMLSTLETEELVRVSLMLAREFKSETQSSQAVDSARLDRRNNFRWSAGVVLSFCADILGARGVSPATALVVQESSVLSTLCAGAVAKEIQPRLWLHRAGVQDIQLPSYRGFWFCDGSSFTDCGFVDFKVSGAWFQRALMHDCVFLDSAFSHTSFEDAVFDGNASALALTFEHCSFSRAVIGFRGMVAFDNSDLSEARFAWSAGSLPTTFPVRYSVVIARSKCDRMDMSGVQFAVDETPPGPSVTFVSCDLSTAILSDWLIGNAVFEDCTLSPIQMAAREGEHGRRRAEE